MHPTSHPLFDSVFISRWYSIFLEKKENMYDFILALKTFKD